MLLPDTAFSVIRIGVPPVFEQVFDDSVVKLNVESAFMYTSVVDDARYALKQLLGTVAVVAAPAFSPPDLLTGTSTTLLNHLAVGLLHPAENLLASAALFAESPTSIDTEFEDFCTVSEKVNRTEKSLTGTTVVCGNLPGIVS
jgi:hypothetical protein